MLKLKIILFTVSLFQEKAKKAGEIIWDWWAEEVCDWGSNEGNGGSVKERSLSCLSCDIHLNMWLVPVVWLHCGIITSSLMFVEACSDSLLINTGRADVYFHFLKICDLFLRDSWICFKKKFKFKTEHALCFRLLIWRSKKPYRILVKPVYCTMLFYTHCGIPRSHTCLLNHF